MQHVEWVGARQIAELEVEVGRMRNRIAQLAVDVEAMDTGIERIGKGRNQGVTCGATASGCFYGT